MLKVPPKLEASAPRWPNGLLGMNPVIAQPQSEMEEKAGVSGKSIKRGTRKFRMPAHIASLAARIGLCSASALDTSMSGARGNTARSDFKTARLIQDNDSL